MEIIQVFEIMWMIKTVKWSKCLHEMFSMIHVQNCWNSEMFEMAKWSKRLKRWEWLKKVEKIKVFEMVIMLKWSKWCCSSFQFNLAETATSWQTKKKRKIKCRQQVQNHFLSEQVFGVLKRKRWKVGSLKDFPLVIIFFIKCKWMIEANNKCFIPYYF